MKHALTLIVAGCLAWPLAAQTPPRAPAPADFAWQFPIETRGADGVVLGEVARVADRHRPAGELGEGGTRGDVDVVQRGRPRRGVGHEGSSRIASPGPTASDRVELPLCHGA